MSNLTPEEQREKLLKRALPALVILIVYFTFFSQGVTEETEKLQKSYKSMSKKGISEEIIPTLEKKGRQINDTIARLSAEKNQKDQELSEHTKGLGSSGDSDAAIVLISDLLSRHHLRIIDDTLDDQAARQAVPLTVKELNVWLKTAARDKEVHGWRVRFLGGFMNTYRAMDEIAQGEIEALPLSLTMQPPREDVATRKGEAEGEMEWMLIMSI